MLFKESNMKFIHQEYNEEYLRKGDSAFPQMKAGLMKNGDTNTPTGVWFAWTYLIKNGK